MSGLGISLAWCAIQVTLLGLITAVLYTLFRRLQPTIGVMLLSFSLLLMVGLTVAGLNPSTRWSWLPGDAASDPVAAAAFDDAVAAGPEQPEAAGNQVERTDVALAEEASASGRLRTATSPITWGELARMMAGQLQSSAVSQRAVPPRWPGLVAVVFCVLSVLALGRLAGGWLLVRRFYSLGTVIKDRRLSQMLQELCDAYGMTSGPGGSCSREDGQAGSLSPRERERRHRPMQVREVDELGSPATIGWRHPLILLPRAWRRWNDEQLRAVLAHELAHVARADFLSRMLAQIAVTIHIYHPLVHWLAARLQLEQELAADCLAAEQVGGNKRYLGVLARMALSESARPAAWPMSPFLPRRGTLIRRIEMLRNPHVRSTSRWARPGRALGLALLLVTGLMVSGIRPWSPLGTAAETGTASSAEPLPLAYVPNEALTVLSLRPAAILDKLGGAPEIAQALNQVMNVGRDSGLRVENLEQFTLVVMNVNERPASVMIMRSIEPVDAEPLRASLGLTEERRVNGSSRYYSSSRPAGFPSPAMVVLSDTTLLYSSDQAALTAALAVGKSGLEGKSWSADWQALATGDVGLMINTSVIAPLVDQETQNADTALMLSMAPLWRNPQYVVGSLQIDEQLRAQISAVCENPQQAERTRQTAQAAIILAGNQLAAIQNNVAARPGGTDDERELLSTLLNVAVTAIEATETTTDGDRAVLRVQLPADSAAQAIATVAPTLFAARRAAYHAQSLNNMKQIMLAMHNYHDVYNALPAVINHKNPGDPGHSWRVALLPYLEQQQLYRQYRFDEPWDSEHNRQLIQQMPDVFRNPNQPADTKFTNYFVFVGGGAIFDPDKAPSFRDITDGTSNTIAIVEAERQIPWTKPEDIPFSPNQPLPQLGLGDGRVSIGLADGAVRTVPLDIPKAVFQKMIMRNDGHPIEWDF